MAIDVTEGIISKPALAAKLNCHPKTAGKLMRRLGVEPVSIIKRIEHFDTERVNAALRGQNRRRRTHHD